MNKRANPKQAARTAKQPGKLDKLDKLDKLGQRWQRTPTRWRIPLTLLCWLAGIGMLIGVPVLIQSFQTPGAALYGHNHTDRPIYSYWVNDKWGGNAAAYGGGTTCCWKIVGEQLEIHWVKSVTRTQSQQGLRKEELTLHLPTPPRKRSDTYLHVHFLPGDEVRLAWSDGVASPFREEFKARFSKEAP
jgi:hypothetical protein